MLGPNLIAAHFDHSRSYDNFRYIYPVVSRRSRGVSIGVNLNPDKKCNFDCIYCEVDRIQTPLADRVELDVLAHELHHMLQIYQDGILFAHEPFARVPPSWRVLNDIAFSGEGEPTTCPVFEEAVEVVRHARAKARLGAAKIILITNAAGLNRADVQRGLRQMQLGPHEIWAKLDAGTPEYYQAVNRSRIPYAWLLKNITETACLCPLIIQSLFLRIHGEPPTEREVIAYAARLNEIREQRGKILSLQLYTVARRTAVPWAPALRDDELDHIASLVGKLTGLPSHLGYGSAP